MKPTIYKGYEIYVAPIGGQYYFIVYEKSERIYSSDLAYKTITACIDAAKHYIDTLIDLYTA